MKYLIITVVVICILLLVGCGKGEFQGTEPQPYQYSPHFSTPAINSMEG